MHPLFPLAHPRTFALVLLVLLLGFLSSASAHADLTARYLGQSGIELTDGSTTITVDFPYEPGVDGAPSWDPEATRLPRTGSLCLFTHSAPDHFDPSILARAGCLVAGPEDVLEAVPEQRRLAGDGALRFGKVGIVPVPTPYGNVEHLSYRIEWEGFRVFLSGDTRSTRELLNQHGLDAAFLVPWLLESPRVLRRVDASRIILVHHDEQTTTPGCERCFVPTIGQRLRLRAGR